MNKWHTLSIYNYILHSIKFILNIINNYFFLMILIPNQQSSVTLYHTSNNSECKCLRSGFRTEEVQRVLACFGYIFACVYVCSKSMSRAAPLSLHSAYVLSHSRCFFSLAFTVSPSFLGDDRWHSFTTDTFRGSIDWVEEWREGERKVGTTALLSSTQFLYRVKCCSIGANTHTHIPL